ncbi:DNA polymerase III subunit gamma/tau [Sulfurovum sp. XTW-4]|uniref:DNA polymerase III subunit gamma/tau n=1 Tax=Sulfurovum xiamenensis TaxID=3019066 RepID=A0ABT7QPJ7_9BACT|nr:DNA polymerase III subunit gamma/tau [Sulfurovum xiamenensis]MDM5263001.1 DNA polymerase III subunit gamma/tau [Sulfurovum xiamenensis]
MSLALARKYRPATFDDLIGQESVSQTLSLALEGKRLSHAYLFSGLRGSGKTSTARIFAKALLCEKGATSHPCGTCTHCMMASESSHMDIIEMDAASNRGIDDIKDLIEHTKYKPSSARYKIFIIDEVHMLTNQAFNALLKTLEEPPDFVKFILATTDPLKLPATILSRTQHFRFKKIPQNLVLKHLEHILDLENIEYEREALDIIARSGAGSLRDSLTLMDQAIVYSKNFVDVNTVTGMLGIIEPSHLETLLSDIMAKDTAKVLAFIKMAADYEAEMILDELTLYLKDLLLNAKGKFSPMIIERFFRVIAESKSLLALGSDNGFVLSLALFKMMESLEIKDIDTMIRGLEQELQGVEVSEIMVTTPSSDLTASSEVITITEEEIDATLPKTAAPKAEPVIEEKNDEASPEITETPVIDNEPTSPIQAAQEEKAPADIQPVTHPEVIQPSTPAINPHQKTFDALVQKLYDRDYDLGACFERNISFENFEDNKLTWASMAEGEDKKMLITHWGLINMFVKDIFGFETKIVNIPKKKVNSAPLEEEAEEPQKEAPVHQDADSASMIEDIEMKSSCIAPDAGETEAAKEKDPSTLLEEPMIKEAIALFDPKKVRIKRNT